MLANETPNTHPRFRSFILSMATKYGWIFAFG